MKYSIKKKMKIKTGKSNKKVTTHVLMTDGSSEILEFDSKIKAEELVSILNENSDSGWDYSVIEIGK